MNSQPWVEKKQKRNSGFYINAAAQREDFGGWISSTISPETIYCCLSEESLRLVDRSNLWGQQILSGGYMSRSLRAVWWSRVLFFFFFFSPVSVFAKIYVGAVVSRKCVIVEVLKSSVTAGGWRRDELILCSWNANMINIYSTLLHDMIWNDDEYTLGRAAVI